MLTTPIHRVRIAASILAPLLLGLAACDSAYYSAWEKLGYHKRDLLVDSVQDARDDQKEAQQQFKTTLERFASVVQVQGGELESRYNKLRAELERSEKKARDVHERIDEVEDVAKDLFAEWKKELDQYTNPELRRSSEQQLRATQDRYDRLIASMRSAEAKMEPVLKVFRDQVLFLKHNLNARAVASIQGTADQLERDVAALLQEMQASINEADAFLETIKD